MKRSFAHLHDQPVDDGQRQRKLQKKIGSLARLRRDFDAPAQLVNLLLHHVHAHAAARTDP